MACIGIINDLAHSVKKTNNELIEHMIKSDVQYNEVCMIPNISFDNYYESLKVKWEKGINEYLDKGDICSSSIQTMLYMYEMAQNLQNLSRTDVREIDPQELKEIVLDKAFDKAIDLVIGQTPEKFVMDRDMIFTLQSLGRSFGKRCQCQLIDIFSYILDKYKVKYEKEMRGLKRKETMILIKTKYDQFNSYVKTIDTNGINGAGSSLLKINNLSIETELNKLIPDSLGSMKHFFIKIITRYYTSLHPIIWAQIFRNIIENVFVALPLTPDEIFSFVSKQLLLNSGPFILKILQMIRPVLTEEMAIKYNLKKLTYPLLEKDQVVTILKGIVNDFNMYKIVFNKSASVGHVCIGYHVRNPNEKIVIKIIKPLAIAQSCSEYAVLYDLFPEGSCENNFVKNMLKSNGAEMNVLNEIKNINDGYDYYTASYNSVFGYNVDAGVTTIQNKANVVKDGVWFALAMTLAPGIPVADLVESNLLEADTKYRANLHRCLDVLVERYFYTIVAKGFYHGDLHAGNMFYSYEEKKITIIDFGAVGHIDIFGGDKSVLGLLDIILKAIYYNYDEAFDVMTDLLNTKCIETQIDKTTSEYKEFKSKLLGYKIKNILLLERERDKQNKYMDSMFSQERINTEQTKAELSIPKTSSHLTLTSEEKSIYDGLEWKSEPPEVVVENKDTLPVYSEMIGESQGVSFAKVLQLMIEFYALSNVNIAIKYSEFYEFQKAYALLIGVLAKVGYSSYRMNMAIKNGILSWEHIDKSLHVFTMTHVISTYWTESKKYNKFVDFINEEKKLYTSV